MTFTMSIPRETFVDATAWVARAVSTKPASPVLAGVLIESDAQKLRIRLSAYDYENSAQIDLDNTLIGGVETGSVLVSGRLLAAIGKALPAGGEVRIEAGGPNARLTCGKAVFTLPTMAVSEYPTLPVQPDGVGGTIDAATLSGALAAVLPAVSRDDAQPKLVSVCVEITNDSTLTLFCTDKHRVAIRQIPWDGNASDVYDEQLLLPAKAASDLTRLSSGEIQLRHAGGVFGVSAGNRHTTSRLLAEEYPNVRKIIPEGFETRVIFDVPDWIATLGRALLLDEQEFPRVRLRFIVGTTFAELTGGQQGIGGLREEVNADALGNDTDVWLNPRYLLDALRTLGADQGVMHITKDRPLVIQPAGHDPNDLTNLHMIMPVAAGS